MAIRRQPVKMAIYRDSTFDHLTIINGINTTKQYGTIENVVAQTLFMPYFGVMSAIVYATLTSNSTITVEAVLVTIKHGITVSYKDNSNIIITLPVIHTENGVFTFTLPSGIIAGTTITIKT